MAGVGPAGRGIGKFDKVIEPADSRQFPAFLKKISKPFADYERNLTGVYPRS